MNPAGWQQAPDPADVHAAAHDAYAHRPTGARVYLLWRADASAGETKWCWRLEHDGWKTEFSKAGDSFAPPWHLIERELKDMQTRITAQ